jgi:hypothetical protein
MWFIRNCYCLLVRLKSVDTLQVETKVKMANSVNGVQACDVT